MKIKIVPKKKAQSALPWVLLMAVFNVKKI